ncbi:formate--tetrahydrofolate ligase [Corynebacterium diphtheriae]|uniref:formate--tetrahydrofolate ligase n=1 Tax=Corynebacterium diphtheriae TaxID=1717 RepID=UPI000245B75A|nr:formate--tetrahydrofolate ligase [Corynebacterium diphtheriae]AEX46465.1 formate-tetrahydrofolate ligase [Corynebacterium diphtheriae INCA 402]AEX81159.1 formate-tetrahydrofolate ligase [Corynebacterium diphtheriae HC04]ERA53219.1 formate--tetrahydrofolate ligase [Corynebacterium diphtheriae str. Aberdeen]KLN41715.1 formate--tetrahydrofolate ligase [Corynebacterium diphtheriae bv. gravis str. ISS 4746]KLN44450.1 formate--tetrahydrofolate ligase [Corynebacterium diphtheriae bv. gravis str. I
MPTDVEIAQAHTLEPITDIANRAGVPSDALIPYGFTKAKIDINRIASENTGKLVLVTGISPTPAGEGKSTVLIGLSDAMRLRGHNSIVAIREPSLGPVMGIKGGAAGGGYSQIVPMEDINLHFTGDFHAITAANNTLAAMIDNHIHQGNALGIDVRRITWQRCLDVNDRSLRKVVTGLGGKPHGVPTETGFTITAASEIMAILCLAADLTDLEARLARIVVGQTFSGEPVTVGQLNAQGALAALLRDAVNPNLVQTLGGTPALCHGGPFANIAHGCNSLIATKTALSLGDVVLTEAGFGSDLGAEKFFDIKSRVGDLNVAATVVVATVRSLKYNAGVPKDELTTENLEALASGVVNLERHVENIRAFGIEPIVALNKFASDTDAEINQLKAWAETMSVQLIPVEVWAHGGQGALELADAVAVSMQNQTSHHLYDPELGIEASLLTIAQKIYGAADVELSKQARQDLAYLQENGWDRLPVCISKTQYSFSDDPSQLGRPEGHTLHVRNLLPRIGAGFIVALTGDVMTMPGLPKKPAAENIGVENGEIKGLF